MKINLTVTKFTAENGKAVVKLIPSLTEAQPEDAISGELFLTAGIDTYPLGLDEFIEIDLTLPIVPPEGAV